MIKPSFNNLSLSNVQLKTDVESKNVPKEISEIDQQAEERMWQYMSTAGYANAAGIQRPSFKGNPRALLKKVAQCSEKELKNLSTKVSEKSLTKNKLSPISTKDEYLEIMERLKNAKDSTGNSFWRYEEDLKFYPNANEIEQGLLPYCGHRDRSAVINSYLSGRGNCGIEESVLEDAVRSLDYSLNALDKEYGKYSGIVYRQGFMGENTGQFFSTSTSSTAAARHNNGWSDPEEVAYRTYSVIKTKGAHKLYDFQAKIKDVFAGKEQEILLPREAKYREISIEECSDDLLKAREEFASHLFNDAYKLFNGSKSKVRGYTKEDLLNLVKVYEEI